jgi:type II secretory pathway component GspD/PulD (secretin)
MKHCRLSLSLAAIGSVCLSSGTMGGMVLQQVEPQRSMGWGTSPGSQGPIRFDRAPISKFIKEMIRRLGIAHVVVDKVSLEQTITLYQDAPVSRQDLLNLFIGGLRDNGAMLVKSGTVHQIVPLSRKLGDGLELITSPAEIVAVPRRTPYPTVQLSYGGAALSDFIAVVAGWLDITPIEVHPAVKGTVTIFSSGAITREMVFQILMAVLENNDARIVECAGRYEVVPVFHALPFQCEILTHEPPPRNAPALRPPHW